MFGLFKIAYGLLLLGNSVVILNDKRFLSRIGLPLDKKLKKYLGENRQKIVEILNGIKLVLRLPLIILNIVCIVYELLFG